MKIEDKQKVIRVLRLYAKYCDGMVLNKAKHDEHMSAKGWLKASRDAIDAIAVMENMK